MKKIKLSETQYKQVTTVRQITNVIHDLPVWMFRDRPLETKNNCPVCRQEMNKQLSHGVYIETCSVVEIDHVLIKAIHTECYHKLTDS